MPSYTFSVLLHQHLERILIVVFVEVGGLSCKVTHLKFHCEECPSYLLQGVRLDQWPLLYRLYVQSLVEQHSQLLFVLQYAVK